MSGVRVLVVDDEPLARRRILRLLKREEGVEVAGVCSTGTEAVEAIRERRPDVVFLDVQMPEMDGFGVVDAVGVESMPTTIFVTAFDQYALRAFEAQALDYLLKPFDAERFARAFQRARERVEERDGGDRTRRLLAMLEQLDAGRQADPEPAPAETTGPATDAEGPMEWLMVRARGRVHFLRAADITWIEAEGNYVRLHVGTDAYLIREKIGTLETRLDPAAFVRVHRSSIVNLNAVRELRPWFSGDYVIALKDGTELRLSRGYRDRLRARVGEYT